MIVERGESAMRIKESSALTQHWSSASVSPSQEKRRQSFHKCGRPKIGLSAVTAKSFVDVLLLPFLSTARACPSVDSRIDATSPRLRQA